jgi:dolichyl-phosphate-mannose-protein mannosyltransferase
MQKGPAFEAPLAPAPSRTREAGAAGRWTILAACLVIALAFVFRWWQCRERLPYTPAAGEHHLGDSALRVIQTADYRPEATDQGSLVIYLDVVADVLHYLDLRAKPDSAPAFVRNLTDIQVGPGELSHPSFFLWNRVVTAMAGAGCVALTFFFASRLFGAWPALAAAALLAGNAAHVQHSAVIGTEVPASCLALACIFLAHRFRESGQGSELLLALLLGGLAASAHYEAGAALVAPWGALIAVTGTTVGSAGFRPWRWVAALAVPLLAFFLGTPYAFLDLPAYLHPASTATSGLAAPSVGPFGVLADLGRTLGWIASALAALGVVALARRRGGWLAIAFPVALFASAALIGFDLRGDELLLAPLAAICFAGGLAWLWRACERWVGPRVDPHVVWLPRAAAGAAVLALAIPLTRTGASAWRAGHTLETRSQALSETARLASERSWKSIGIAGELRVHPQDLRRLEGLATQVLPGEELFARRAEFDAIVWPALCAGTESDAEYATAPDELAAARARAAKLNELRPTDGVVATFGGPSPLSLNAPSRDPGVLVLGRQ